jgi:cyclic nucleotide-binding protein
MQHNEIKQRFVECPELAGLDEIAAASLFWSGDQQTLEAGAVIYAEGDRLDGTFCLLLSGNLAVEKAGMVVGEVLERQIFGEMAYFTNPHSRTATVRVASPQALILKMQLAPAELGNARLTALKRYLGLQAWDRFVNTSQSAA